MAFIKRKFNLFFFSIIPWIYLIPFKCLYLPINAVYRFIDFFISA